MNEIIDEQHRICERYGAIWVPSPEHFKVGISRDFDATQMPINGLRHPIQNDVTGWYIWSGKEMSSDPLFFVPLHVSHLDSREAKILKYLGLPPGWRFLFAGNHEDVWEDQSLLLVD